MLEDDNWGPLAAGVSPMGVALAKFPPSDQPAEKWQLEFPILTLQIGDRVTVSQQCRDWYYGLKESSGFGGIFPRSYIHLGREGDECSKEEGKREKGIIDKIEYALWEMEAASRKLYSLDPTPEWKAISAAIKTTSQNLHKSRDKLVRRDNKMKRSDIDYEEKDALRKIAQTTKSPFFNKLEMDLVLFRDKDERMVSSKGHSAVALYDMHLRETESDCYKNKKALPQDSHFSSRNPKPVNKTYSVSLNVNNFEITDLKLADSVSKLVDLNVSVYEVDPNDVSRPRALCESLVIREWSLDSRSKKCQEVVFMVTANQLITTEKHNLYLICNVTTSPSCSGFRKPVGVCARYIQLNIHRAGGQPNNEEDCLFLPTNNPQESLGDTFKRLYDHHLKYDGDIQRKKKTGGQPAGKLAVELSLALAEGNPVQEGSTRPESWNARPATFINPENQQRHIAQKLGLPDNILPDDDRNDLYVTIHSGMFDKGDKFRDRSIEVQMEVWESNKEMNEQGKMRHKGRIVPNAIVMGAGGKKVSSYSTVVYTHSANPFWNETVKIRLNPNQFTRCHLRFLIRHRSQDRMKDDSKKHAVCYLRLVDEISKDTALKDGFYQLFPFSAKDKEKYLLEKEVDCTRYLDLSFIKTSWETKKPVQEDLNESVKREQNDQRLWKMTSTKDYLEVHIKLASTKLVQSPILYKLLTLNSEAGGGNRRMVIKKIRDMADPRPQGNQPGVGGGVGDVTGGHNDDRTNDHHQLVNHLYKVLDTLVQQLMETGHTNEDDDIFQSLISCILLVKRDEKYSKFLTGLIRYIEVDFCHAQAYSTLLELLKDCVLCITQQAHPTGPQMRALQDTMSCLFFIFKFIVHSRLTHMEQWKWSQPTEEEKKEDQDSFEHLLETEVLGNLVALMGTDAPEGFTDQFRTAQADCLSNVVKIVPDLCKVFDPLRLTQKLVDIVMPNREVTDSALIMERLRAIRSLVSTCLFKDHACRRIIVPKVVAELKKYMDSNFETVSRVVRTLTRSNTNRRVSVEAKTDKPGGDAESEESLSDLCNEALGQLLDELHKIRMSREGAEKEDNEIDNDIGDIVDKYFDSVVRAVIKKKKRFKPSSETQATRSLVTSASRDDKTPSSRTEFVNFIALLNAMTPEHFEAHFKKVMRSSDGQMVTITEILKVLQELMMLRVFPKYWLYMVMSQNMAFLKALQHLGVAVRTHMTGDFFDEGAWMAYFDCARVFICQPSLKFETFTDTKQKHLTKYNPAYPEMRREMGSEVHRMWIQHLGTNKEYFIPKLVGHILEIYFTEPDLRKYAIPIFFDMMQFEYFDIGKRHDEETIKPNFDKFKTEMIHVLDSYVVDHGLGNMYYRDKFYEEMSELCQSHTSLKVSGLEFVKLVDRLMTHLLEYRQEHAISNRDEYKTNEMICVYNLLEFYKTNLPDHEELFVKYIIKLYELHKAQGQGTLDRTNWAEAGYILDMYAKDKLRWNDYSPLSSEIKNMWIKTLPIEKDGQSPVRTVRDLKEKLYKQIMKLLKRGNIQEGALETAKELEDLYETDDFDYTKLARLHDQMAEMYRAIVDKNQMRMEPQYYRVSFWGKNHPAVIQNKTFVYRGKPRGTEDVPASLKEQYPNSKIYSEGGNGAPPSDEVKESADQLLQYTQVHPVHHKHSCFKDKVINHKVMAHYEFNCVDRFYFEVVEHRPMKDKQNEFKTMWAKKTILKTREKFPGILTWSQVEETETETTEASPPECAIQIQNKGNQQLEKILHEYIDNDEHNLNTLQMTLQGQIDSPVNGGVAMFTKAFLNGEYEANHPEQLGLLLELKRVIADQLPLLELGMRLFRDRRAPEQKDWFDAYNEMLNRKKPDFIETYGQGELTNPTLILFNKQYSEEAQPEQNAAFQLQQLAIPNGGNPRSSYQSVASSDYSDTTASTTSSTVTKDRGKSVFSFPGLKRRKSNAAQSTPPIGAPRTTLFSGPASGGGGISRHQPQMSPIPQASGGGSRSNGNSRPSSGHFVNLSIGSNHSRSPSVCSSTNGGGSGGRDSFLEEAPDLPPKNGGTSMNADSISISSQSRLDHDGDVISRHSLKVAGSRDRLDRDSGIGPGLPTESTPVKPNHSGPPERPPPPNSESISQPSGGIVAFRGKSRKPAPLPPGVAPERNPPPTPPKTTSSY